MDVERAEAGEFEDGRGEDLPKGRDDEEVGVIGGEGRDIFWALEGSRLPDRDIVSQGSLFYWRKSNFLSPAGWFIWTGYDGDYFVAFWQYDGRGSPCDKRFEGRYRELWCAHIYDA